MPAMPEKHRSRTPIDHKAPALCKISSRVGIRAPHIGRQHLIQGRSTQIALQIPQSVTDTG